MQALEVSLEKRNNYIVHPLKFALWLFILTVIMIFGGMTSAYIVHRGTLTSETMLLFDLPSILWYNLALMLVSSITMQYGVWSMKKQDRRMALVGMGMTAVLGGLFLAGQWQAFMEMSQSGLVFVDQTRIDDSVSYFYVITGLHGVHIIAGLLIVLIVFGLTAANRWGRWNPRLTYELTATFWHFLGLLWVYLFIFLKYTQN